MAEPDGDERGQWLLKGVSHSAREAAVAHAARRGERIGQWMERAALRQCDLEDGDRLFEPTLLDKYPPAESTAPDFAPAEAVNAQAQLAFAALDGLGRAAANGLTVPAGVQRHVWALVGGALRQARGLKKRQPPPPKQIEGRNGNAGLVRLGIDAESQVDEGAAT